MKWLQSLFIFSILKRDSLIIILYFVSFCFIFIYSWLPVEFLSSPFLNSEFCPKWLKMRARTRRSEALTNSSFLSDNLGGIKSDLIIAPVYFNLFIQVCWLNFWVPLSWIVNFFIKLWINCWEKNHTPKKTTKRNQ